MRLWSTPDLKKFNKERIRKEIQKHDKCTKAMISRMTELSLVTCNSLLNEMLADREILETTQKELIMGRPAAQFHYNNDYLHVLGIWVSDEKNVNVIDCTTADAAGKVLSHERVNPEKLDYDVIEAVIEKSIAQDDLIKCITVGIPGVSINGTVESCDVSSLVGEPLGDKLSEKFHIDVDIHNDMDFMTYGIYHTSYKGNSNLAVIYFPRENSGTVGSGFYVNGQIVRGFSQNAGALSNALECFGLSREWQNQIINNDSEIVSYIQKISVIISAVIDPEEIYVLGVDLDKEQLDQIKGFLEEKMTLQHAPKIVLDKDGEDRYRTGLICAGINHMLFPLSEAM